jgi:3-ketosteroid 9alpha-monooxygenase subunit B
MDDTGPASASAAGTHGEAAAAASPRRRIATYAAVVEDVIRETHDTVTLVLDTPARADYAAGHFLTIDPHQFEELQDLTAYLEDAKGRREKPRAYSMCSSPLEPRVAVTVKEERYVRGVTRYPPLLSPYLVRRVVPDQPMTVVGFTGAYVLPRDVESRAEHLVHLVAGSGSVPNFAILKYALAVHPRLRHTFVYSNKTWDDVIFRDALAALEARFPERLRVVHTLTREEHPERHGSNVRKGRVRAELLREVIPDPGTSLVYACGPGIGPFERAAARARFEPPAPRFLETVLVALSEIGVPKDRVRTEVYG